MPVQLQLASQDGLCRVVLRSAPERVLAETALADLPSIDELIRNPYQLGEKLFAALGGMGMRELLEQSNDRLLLLECDQTSQAIAWEYASYQGQFLACEYAMLRLVPRTPLPVRQGRPQLLVLCADPLVYPNGEPSYRLNSKAELQALQAVFQKGKYALEGRQIAPTAEQLFAALQEGPAFVHFSCHGGTIPFQTDSGIQNNAVLQLEDKNGLPKNLLGNDLRIRAPCGSLAMVLLSACQSGPIAHALAQQGVPIALGMQHNFPDPLSDTLAAEFYRSLLNGYDIAEASRLARASLAAENPYAAGMLVVYSCQNAWLAPALDQGQASFSSGLAGDCRLPASLLAGNRELIGRDTSLAELAALFDDDSTAVTINGMGGIGKTSLARGFIQRFGWRFGRVLGVSFAAATVDLARICRELLEQLGFGNSLLAAQDQQTQQQNELIQTHRKHLAELELQKASFGLYTPPHINSEIARIEGELAQLNAKDLQQETTERLLELLHQAIQPNDLLLFDNYESVLNSDKADQEQAAAIERLLPKLIERQARLVLTSRARPAGLRGEKLFPSRAGLGGLQLRAAIELFGQHSTRSQGQPLEQHQKVMETIAHETQGHPLAIILLASAYDSYTESAEAFLQGWSEALARAEKQGLEPRHRTIAVAIERSISALEPKKQVRLLVLSNYQMPFFSEGAALLWELPCDVDGDPSEVALSEARADLELFVERSLLQVHKTFEGGDLTETYQFQPIIHQELFRRLEDQAQPAGYYRYGFWLAKLAYGEIGRSTALAQLVYQSLVLLDESIEELDGEERLWHIRRLAWLYRQYGEVQRAQNLLEEILKYSNINKISELYAALEYELGSIYQIQGLHELSHQVFKQSLTIYEDLNNLQGKATTLHAIAEIHRAQGKYQFALQFFQQSLVLRENLNDLQGLGETLQELATTHRLQGAFDHAMDLYNKSLAIKEKLQDLRGKSITLHAIATTYRFQGQYQHAMYLYEQVLSIREKLHDLHGKAYTLNGMADIYQSQGDYERANQLYQQALTITEYLNDLHGKGSVFLGIADLHCSMGEYQQAIELYQKCYSIHEKLNDVRGKGIVLHRIANIYQQQGKYQQAMHLYQQSLSITEKLNNLHGKGQVLNRIAKLHILNQNWSEARLVLQDSSTISQKLGDQRGIAFTQMQFGELYLAQGDYAAAQVHFQTSLKFFEKLRMSQEVEQVQKFIGKLTRAQQDIK